VKRPRHIPDASRPVYTYCGRVWQKYGSPILAVIDTRVDSIEDAECKACQRSDDRRTREEYAASVKRDAAWERALPNLRIEK
jgi:hypothetical protein